MPYYQGQPVIHDIKTICVIARIIIIELVWIEWMYCKMNVGLLDCVVIMCSGCLASEDENIYKLSLW